MYRSLKWQLSAYLISAALIMSVMISFNFIINRSVDPIFPPSKSMQSPSATHYYASLPKAQSLKVNSMAADKVTSAAAVQLGGSSAVTLPAQIKPPEVSAEPTPDKPALHIEPIIHTYEVTSFYLNVRSEPNSKSKIMKVVEKGTELSVVTKTASGWLQLKDGGYVHGDYAAPPARDVKTKLAVRTLSFGSEGAKQPVSITPQKLIVKRALSTPARPASTVNSDSGLTAEHIALILKGTKLAGQGLEEAILDIEEEYGINAFFTIAVMKLESGNGKSRLSRTKNNLFGLNAITGSENTKAFNFATKADSVRKFGQLLSKNYVNKGLTTIEKVAKKYCPANGRWSGHVKSIMKGDFRKLA